MNVGQPWPSRTTEPNYNPWRFSELKLARPAVGWVRVGGERERDGGSERQTETGGDLAMSFPLLLTGSPVSPLVPPYFMESEE